MTQNLKIRADFYTRFYGAWHEKIFRSQSSDGEVGQNWNFIKIIWVLHNLKALNERISESTHFLNLAKQFWRYIVEFSLVPQKWGFFRQDLKETYIFEMAPKWRFLKAFLQFPGNKHSLCLPILSYWTILSIWTLRAALSIIEP